MRASPHSPHVRLHAAPSICCLIDRGPEVSSTPQTAFPRAWRTVMRLLTLLLCMIGLHVACAAAERSLKFVQFMEVSTFHSTRNDS